jgi:hypothetical protein
MEQYGVKLDSDLYNKLIQEYYPEATLMEKDMSIKYFKRACRVIRNSVIGIKPK